ncbi:GDSL esterase/lipase [Rosa sericea]
MTKDTLKWLMVIAVLVVSKSQSCVHGAPQVPCFFIFGDSLADNGNNNLLTTLAKVNYAPYGIDYPGGVRTGRFSNGKITVDILAEFLGFETPIPPFATTEGQDIVKGLNYASGAAGIRAETGSNMGGHISLDQQLLNHQITILRIASILRTNTLQTLQYLNKCLYSVGMGNNDYFNNYFMPQFYPTSKRYTPEQYASVLIDQYTSQILTLYNKYGARKVALVGLGLIGCTPNAISKTKGTTCIDEWNSSAQLFNQKLVPLVDQLNTNLTDAKFIYVNSTGMSSGDPTSVGFKVLNVGCCPVNNVGQCVLSGTPCQNRSEYVFWDSFHPTEASNQITAFRTYKSVDPTDNYPMDVSHLVQLKL